MFFLDLAESSPFIEINGREEVVGFLQHYDASNRTGSLFSLTFGGEYETFGQNLFTEARGFFTSHSTMDVNEYDRRSESWDSVRRNTIGSDDVESLTPKELEDLVGTEVLKHPDIRFVGWVGSIDGEAFDATSNFAWGDPIHIRTQRQVKFLGGDFVTGVSFGREGRRRTSLFIGPSYKRLTQEAEIFAYESNRESTVNNMALGEKLKSSYYGGVAGIHIDAPFKKRWNFSVGGEFGIYYLDSEYEGFQKTFLSSGGPDDLVAATVYLKTSDSKMTAATGVQASLRVKYLTRITFEVESGIKYQAHSPVMRYARLGESFRNRIAHSPARLEYAGMFGFLGKFSVGFEF